MHVIWYQQTQDLKTDNIKRAAPPLLSLVVGTSCCHGDGPQSRWTHKHCETMHQCGATILIIEAVSPPRLPLSTITSTLTLQRKRYWSKRSSPNNCKECL